MGRIQRILSLLVTGCLLFTTTAQAVSAWATVDVPFYAENASNEAVLSEMAIHPAAVRQGSVTYIAYQGPGFDPYVVGYDEATDRWDGPYRVGTNPLVLDAHGAPSLFFDPAGRLHALYGGHGSTLYHARAVIAGAIDTWEELPRIDSVGTYPQVMDSIDGRVLLFYRGLNDWIMRESDADRTSFGEAVTLLSASRETWWYADFRAGTGGKVHAAFVCVDNIARATGLTIGRRNAYYMVREPTGEWYTATGTPLPLPLTRESADASARIFDSQGASVNEISVKEDSSGAPCVLYLTGIGAGDGAYSWVLARFAEGEWTFNTVTTADHVFDSGAVLPGAGGALEALLVAGDSGAVGENDIDPRGRGGAIERWMSDDFGRTWDLDSQITPDEPLTLFADPQFVRGGEGAARAVFVEWNTDGSNFFNRMFLWGDGGLVSREVTPTVERLAGAARAQTAVEVSKLGFPEGARTVVIASERNFPDALAGVPLANDLWAPLLLSSPETISPGVAEEIDRLGATKAVLLGGTNALGSGIEEGLLDRTGVTTVERIAGATRYDTALEIARRLYDPLAGTTDAIVVSGENWPDAATAAPLAAAWGVPILLTRRDDLPSQTANALAERGTRETYVVGGTAVISKVVEDQLPSPTRLAGATRYETAAVVAEAGLGLCLLPHRVLVATGTKFPDALAGATLASRLRAPVLLTQQEELHESSQAYVKAHGDTLTRYFIIGDTGVVSPRVADWIEKRFGE